MSDTTTIHSILSELRQIHRDIKEVKETCQRLNEHIDFVETTYEGLYRPIEYIKTYFVDSNNNNKTKKETNKVDGH